MTDINPLSYCFRDADAIFTARFRAIEEIKKDCLVGIDANVLLAPYSLSEEPLAYIAATYERLAGEGRLIIPAHAAREFAKNRNAKIGELLKTVKDQMSRQSDPMAKQYAFLKNLPDYEIAIEIAGQIQEKQRALLTALRRVADSVRSGIQQIPFGTFIVVFCLQRLLSCTSPAEKP
ncbi:PIN-like domain-containing protein [Chelatococcus sp. GCM10030263]|uniref:PIN-like domain-containing protein n=1 Tax=Chelatococcus sp. GCM10030263 TaxID=3273387 RepID=UPI00360F1972